MPRSPDGPAARLRLPAALLALLAAPALGETLIDPPDGTLAPYPPATCAALWEGFADKFGDDDGERALAARFRGWSEDLIGAAETEALVAERRSWVRDLLEAYVLDGDDQSRDIFERLVRECGEMAADIPPAP